MGGSTLCFMSTLFSLSSTKGKQSTHGSSAADTQLAKADADAGKRVKVMRHMAWSMGGSLS